MKAKKILAVLMTAAVLMGTAAGSTVTTFAAAPEGVVTVQLPETAADTKLSYVQIIEEDTTSGIGYKFNSEVEAEFVSKYATAAGIEATPEAVLRHLFDIAETEGENTNATAGKIHESEALSAGLEAVRNVGKTSMENASFDPENMGLYMIVAEKEGWTFNPMAVYVGPDFNGVTVAAKGAGDQLHKKVEESGQVVAKGDVIEYTVTAQYPYYPANASDPKFVIKDTVENAVLNKDVTIDGFEANTDYTVDYISDTEMEINFTYNRAYAGKTVNVVYTVTVGDITSKDGMIVKNTAISELDKGYTVAEVNSDSAKFTVIKTDDAKEPNRLGDAEFTLYVKDEKGTEEIKYNNETIKVTKVAVERTAENDDEETADFNEKGTITFYGLDPDKTYYVKETDAPEGYSRNEEVFILKGADKTSSTTTETLTDDYDTEYTKETTTVTVTDYEDVSVVNTKLSALPSTGGIGTTIFTIGGCVIMVAAAGLYFSTRKKEEN